LSRHGALNAACYDLVIGRKPGLDNLKTALGLTRLYLTLFNNIILAQNEQIFAELILADGRFIDPKCVSRQLLRLWNANAHK
jgi:hypothetical protein